MEADIRGKLTEVRAGLDSFKQFTAPNEPIAGFSLLDGSFHATWNVRFGEITRDNFIEEITAFLAAIELPKLSAKNLRHDHLVIYHHVSELRELARNALSEAMVRGYPHAFNVIAQTHEIAPDLRHIATSLQRIEKKIEVIENRTIPDLTAGIAIKVGPLSVNLKTLKQLAISARNKIRLDEPNTNVGALTLAISKIADISNEISKQLNAVVRQIPSRLRLAINDVIRSANQVADRGVELLRKARSSSSSVSNHAVSEIASSRTEQLKTLAFPEIGAALKSARISMGVKIPQVSRHLKLPIESIEAMEAGRFGELGRTYAIGYVRAYSSYLGITAEEYLQAIRAQLPDDEWNRPFKIPQWPMGPIMG